MGAVDGVSEFPSANRAAALGPGPAQTIIALSTRGNRADEHALANGITFNADAQFVNDADWLMTNDQPGFHWILASENMEIRSTYRGQRHANHRFAWSRLRN